MLLLLYLLFLMFLLLLCLLPLNLLYLFSPCREECRVLGERWQSEECMQAVLKFFQERKKKSKL